MDKSEIFSSILKDYTDETNPLQDTYLIKVKSVEEIGTIAKKIDGILNVESVQYGAGMVEQLLDIFETIKYGIFDNFSCEYQLNEDDLREEVTLEEMKADEEYLKMFEK